MARIRTIKPEFPEDETLGAVSRDARFLYVLLWTRCDDLGRFRASPALLRSHCYPYDAEVTVPQVNAWLDELIDAGRVRVYEIDGQQYGEVVKWSKHQRIDNASKSTLFPNPPWFEADGYEPPSASAGLGESPPAAAGGEGIGGEWKGPGGEGEAAATGGTAPAQVVDLAFAALADRITKTEKRRDASRYRSGVLKSLRAERGSEALALVVANPDWDVGDLLEALEPSPTATVLYLPDPDCERCHGSGWVETDGTALECPCKQRRTA